MGCYDGSFRAMDIIELQGVSKKYRIYARPGDRLRELLTLNRRRYHQEHWAVRDVTVGIRRGETFCVIGENGSGKSTLLQLIAGILTPTSGQVLVHGRITALLELGSGFNQEYTGRENVHLNGAILGFAAGEVERKLGQILEFAEIGEFVDQPLRAGAKFRKQDRCGKERKGFDAVLVRAQRARRNRVFIEGGVARSGIVETAKPEPFDRRDAQQIKHHDGENAPLGDCHGSSDVRRPTGSGSSNAKPENNEPAVILTRTVRRAKPAP